MSQQSQQSQQSQLSSNFEKVVDFNKQFGITLNEKPIKDIFDLDPKLVQYRMSLIREEMKELEDAVITKNYTETVDALTDILYVVYGMYASIGTNADLAFDIVHDSNMSKMCKNEQEAIDTVAWYKSHQELGYDTPNYRKSYDDKYYVVYNESTKKILKSIKYTPANFSKLLQ